VKAALVEGLQEVFENHPDDLLTRTRVTLDFPQTEADYPTIIVRFFEREIKNAGVGHVEWIASEDGDLSRHKHYLYNGDIEFAVYALSSLDRDLLSDSLVQIISMGNLEGYTNAFLDRIYEDSSVSNTHYVNLNTDQLQGFGENQTIAPWSPEDVLTYSTAYRVGINGEFYNLPPADVDDLVSDVDVYPYRNLDDPEPVPEGADDDAEWLDQSDRP
jgi:hypothetical protein